MFSDRIDKVEPFMVMRILERALELEEQGEDIIHMEIGEPDFDTPSKIIEGCTSEIRDGKTHYTHSLGFLELRKALSQYKFDTRGINFDPKTQFMITCGTSPAFFLIFSILLNPDDEVIITDPGYPCYKNYVKFFGGKPIFLPIFEADGFDFNIETLKQLIKPRTKAIILNSPSNPTGQIISEKTLEELTGIVRDNNIWIISDEIYSELTYEQKIAPSLSEERFKDVHNRLVVLDGFSKFWAMTGWRIGYIISSPELIEKMMPLQQNFFICAPSVSQSAALHALECEQETSDMLKIYRKRRDFIIDRINHINGLSCLKPKGAFYAFANIKQLGISSLDFSMRLLEEGHVATTPGISFGENGEGYIRISYPTSMEKIKIGLNRIEEFIQEKL
ncbi:MAG: aminotransferase class I/II-fold pyridoxal phosphate-dependent enzyme [Candidatus Lokiarchaeota archaeon]|nr:aminotransferase class I/II-fold pyridoxal phosphate-dependent enzyme [Candidatus Lokiarchaeota archaeon]